MLEILVVPACFLLAGMVGHRLGTPTRVAAGLVAVGCCHLLAFLSGGQALEAGGAAAGWVHLVSQWLFLGGFVALVWLAAVYPDHPPRPALLAVAGGLAVLGPLLAALSGATPALVDDSQRLGPVVDLLPDAWTGVAAVPLVAIPLLAVGTFAMRYRRAPRDDRAAMRWPLLGLLILLVLVLAGTLLGPQRQTAVTALFLLGAPVFPLAVAFGPVLRRLDTLTAELGEARTRLARRASPTQRAAALSRLSPRELTVLEHMADGMANPVIARTMHLSLSSVEKHATSLFRKLEIPDGPEVHRRVAAVIAYRDALEHRGDST